MIILVEFPDAHHTLTPDQVKNIAIDQVNSYYQEVSYGKVSVTGEVYGWFTMSRPLSYYGHDASSTNTDVNLDQLVTDALAALPTGIDLSSFNFLEIVHAGQDQAYSSRSDDIWSQCSCAVFPNYQPSAPVSLGSKSFPDYAVLSELNGFGTYAHELGHHFGLPDLYDTQNEDSFIGYWSLMDSGNWCCYNDKQTTPTYIGAWGATLLGWISPTVADQSAVLTSMGLRPLESASPSAVLIPVSSHTYYFIEDRVQHGEDSHLPDAGIVVYFADELLETGHGILKLVDPSTGKLEPEQQYPSSFTQVVFRPSDKFNDPFNSVYLAFFGGAGQYSALYSRQQLTGSVKQSNLRLLSTTPLAEMYTQQFTVTGILSDQSGTPLNQQTVESEILDPSSNDWQVVGSSVTDSQGLVSISTGLNYSVGIYRFRLFYPGAAVGSGWYFSATTESPLTITPATINLAISAPTIVTTDKFSIDFRIADSEGKPVPGALLSILIDGVSKYSLVADNNGTAHLDLWFGFNALGSHTISARINSANYVPTEGSTSLTVLPPVWITGLIAAALVFVGALALRAKIGRRPQPETMHCIQCGKEIPKDSDFCPECGTKI